ncbi:hypothetical protein MSG28_011137 [Choristoneura fumiferana]|uniref:Uncharacterized protein n=1 Tax=Choristoneura fumiferana TaxID=7141 RepID=A0ACC0KQF9_CHOFU|nr:hypothetical protein MSG28_011137 [Choristoneura fumiferana]
MRCGGLTGAAPYCTRSCSRYTPLAAGAPVAYCARPGMRLWRADRSGAVLHTLMFKVHATSCGRARGVLRAAGMRLWRVTGAAPYCTRSCSRYTPLAAGAPVAYCARPGMRLWRADRSGAVLHTLMFKRAVLHTLMFKYTPLAAGAPVAYCARPGMRLWRADRSGAVLQHAHVQGTPAIAAGAPVAYCARPGMRLWRADRSGAVLHTLMFKLRARPWRTARGPACGCGGLTGAAPYCTRSCSRYTPLAAGAPVAYCARPGMRLWRADRSGAVLHTLMFKRRASAVTWRRGGGAAGEYNLGPLHVYRDSFLVAHNEHFLYVLDPDSLRATAVVDDLRRILSVAVNKDEIFVLEGPRSLLRLAHAPEPAALASAQGRSHESVPGLMVLRALLQDHMHTRLRHMLREGEGEGGAAKSAA